MQQLVVLSGKGGTGKTTIASALIKLSKADAYADCDVDAPNLHLICNNNKILTKKDYYAMPKAVINQNKCINCFKCKNNCRFDAIELKNSHLEINSNYCEGCGVCQLVCPINAISLVETKAGETVVYENNGSIFSTGTLKMGNGTTGKLVYEVKRNLVKQAPKDCHFSIIDGSPGIGCPVIASLSGANVVLIVAEGSMSGLSDLKRIIKTSEQFNLKIFVCINKYDINTKITDMIKAYCLNNKIMIVGEIPYDIMAVKAINQGKSVIDIECKSGSAIRNMYKCLLRELHGGNNANKSIN